MAEKKLTPWFPADVKPVHVGWYQRNWGRHVLSNDYWNGEYWQYHKDDLSQALNNKPWRGLAVKPK